MANWCNTNYHIDGKAENVKKLFSDLNRVFQEKGEDGDLGLSCGLDDIGKELLGLDDLNPAGDGIHCRGEITEWDYEQELEQTEDGLMFSFCTYTAWVDCREIMFLLSQKYDVNVYFITAEFGEKICETNDTEGKYFKAKYICSTYDLGEPFNNFESLAGYVEDETGTRPEDFDEAVECMEENGCGCILEVEYVSLEDF